MTVSGRRNVMIVGALLAALFLAPGPAAADDPDNCLFCHQYRGLSRYDDDADHLYLFFVHPEYTRDKLGPHARVACTDCHPREEVAVVPHLPVSRVDCTRTCHLADPGGLARRFSHRDVQEMLTQSVHSEEVLRDTPLSGGPVLGAEQSTCLYCHDEPIFRDPAGVIPTFAGMHGRTFDRCDVCHAVQVPLDVAYYLRHVAARLQTARPTLEMAQVCAVCHSDPRVLAEHDFHDAVASYVRSFHGKAALLGDEATANCVSCHVATGANAHQMLGADQPLSAISPERVGDSCRTVACHPGAEKSLAAAGVHLDLPSVAGTVEYALAAAFILLTIATFVPSMVIVVLELFAQVIGREHHAARKLEELTHRLWLDEKGRQLLTRFTVSERVQHWMLAILFTLLAITGFPMKFATEDWSRNVVNLVGGLHNARLIHHWAGIALFAGLIAHSLYALRGALRWRQRERQAGRSGSWSQALISLPMWVGPQDALKGLQLVMYLLFLRREPPTFGRFTIKEKFEYFGVFWGTTLLGLTGIILWGEQFFSHYLGGRAFNLALIAHTYEAFLAIIHVGILHIINVMLKPNVFPLSLATITGRTPLAELAEEHTDQVLDVARKLGYPTEGATHE